MYIVYSAPSADFDHDTFYFPANTEQNAFLLPALYISTKDLRNNELSPTMILANPSQSFVKKGVKGKNSSGTS